MKKKQPKEHTGRLTAFLYDIPMLVFGTKEELGRWTGKTYRASICILDEGFARSIEKKISLNMEV